MGRSRAIDLADGALGEHDSLALVQHAPDASTPDVAVVDFISWKPGASHLGVGQRIFLDGRRRAKFSLFREYPYAKLNSMFVVHPHVGVSAPRPQRGPADERVTALKNRPVVEDDILRHQRKNKKTTTARTQHKQTKTTKLNPNNKHTNTTTNSSEQNKQRQQQNNANTTHNQRKQTKQ